MLKRIKIRNFLSLKEVDLELRRRNVLVGPNMSGKSNLIESFKFVRDAVALRGIQQRSSIQDAVLQRGGFNEISWKGAHPRAPVAFEIVAETGNAKDRTICLYKYEFCLASASNSNFEVSSELLTVASSGAAAVLIENANGKLRVLRDRQYTDGPQNRLSLALELFGPNPDTECHRFWQFVQGWRFYRLVPELMRRGSHPGWEKYLSEHGENLSSWLLTLQNHPEEFNGIKQICRDVLNGVSEILFQPAGPPDNTVLSNTGNATSSEASTISVGTGEVSLRRPIGISRMSDGELSFLALVSLIQAPQELTPSLLCIEELENHLHPALIEVLVELLDQRQLEADAPQLIATTHSPLLVDKLTIDDLVVTERKDGATKFSRPSTKRKLRELLNRKDLGLGDLWYSGALGSSQS